jgi:hypothetical protein
MTIQSYIIKFSIQQCLRVETPCFAFVMVIHWLGWQTIFHKFEAHFSTISANISIKFTQLHLVQPDLTLFHEDFVDAFGCRDGLYGLYAM